jgi:hypothetical protein
LKVLSGASSASTAKITLAWSKSFPLFSVVDVRTCETRHLVPGEELRSGYPQRDDALAPEEDRVDRGVQQVGKVG